MINLANFRIKPMNQTVNHLPKQLFYKFIRIKVMIKLKGTHNCNLPVRFVQLQLKWPMMMTDLKSLNFIKRMLQTYHIYIYCQELVIMIMMIDIVVLTINQVPLCFLLGLASSHTQRQ